MWSNTLDDGVIKFFVNLGTQLVKIIDNVGLIKTLFIGIGTYLISKNFNGDLFGGLFGKIELGSIDTVNEKLKTLKKNYEDAQNAFNANHSKENEKYLKKSAKEYERYKAETKEFRDGYAKETKNLENLKAQKAQLEQELLDAKNEVGYFWSQEDEAGIKQSTQKIDELTRKINETGKAIQTSELNLQTFNQTQAVSGNIATTAWAKVKAGAKTAGKAILSAAKSMVTMYAITTIFELVGKVFEGIGSFFDNIIETPEEAQEKFEELNSELSTCKSELRSLESELDNTQKQIDELISSGELSFSDQEELDRLKAQSAELERQIALKKTLQESLQQGTNAASINAANKYLNTSFLSDKTKTERQEEASEKGKTWGSLLGLLGGIAIAIGSIAAAAPTGGLSLAGLGAAASTIGIGAGVGAAVGKGIGGSIGSAIGGASYDSEQTVGEAIDNMAKTRDSLIKARDEAYQSYLNSPSDEKIADNYAKAEEALSKYDETMAKHITQIQENYNAMDWSTASTEQKEIMKEQADLLDKYNISMGSANAKSNAITRIFNSKEATQELKNLDQQIKDTVKSEEEVDFNKLFTQIPEEAIQRLRDIGISLTDLKYYYLDWKKVEDEAESSIYDTVKAVNSLSGGIKNLKDAFSEFNEQGLVSADTLVSLYDTFGSLGDAWDSYVDVMASGTASTKEAQKATKDLLETFMNQRLEQGPIKDMKEYLTLLGQLQSLGVSNPKGYVDALQRTSIISGIGKDIVNQTKELKELEEQYKNGDITQEEYNTKKANLQKTQEDFIKQYETEYGITLSAKERLAIEKAITAERAKQAATTAEVDANAYNEAQKTRDQAKEDLDNANAALEAAKEGTTRKVSEVGNRYWRNGVEYWQYNGKYYINGDEQVSYSDPKAVKNAQVAVDAAKKVYDDAEEKLKLTPNVDVDATKESAENAADDLQATFDDLGLTIQIELTESKQAVDDIQSIFDTLSDAQKEYNQNGYFTVDTMQELLSMESKYLALLFDENGNLSLNKDTLYQVAIARLTDMKLKQQDAILSGAERLAASGTVEALNEQINAMYGEAEAYDILIQARLKSIRTLLEERQAKGELVGFNVDTYMSGLQGQLDAIEKVTNSAIQNIQNSLSTGGNTIKDDTNEAFQKEMEYWENQISANQAKYEQIQNEIDLLEKQGKKAGKEYYAEQLELEEERRKLLEGEDGLGGQKKAAEDYLKMLEDAGQEGSEEWFIKISPLIRKLISVTL